MSKTQHFEVGATNNVAKYVNHYVPGYFDQNCNIVRHDDNFYIQTTREVKPGQEFFCDYGNGYWTNDKKPLTKEDLEKAEIKGNIFWREYDENEDESCETKTENDESEEEDDDGSDDNFIPKEEEEDDE